MSHPVHARRARAAVAAGALSLALSLVAAPAALAQEDGPEATMTDFLTAFEAMDIESLPGFFCAEYQGQALGWSDAIASILPEGLDPGPLLEAVVIDAEVSSLETISQTEVDASVRLVATVSTAIDTEAVVSLLGEMATAMGQDVEPAVLEALATGLAGQFQFEPTVIDREVRLVPGDTRPWLICDQLIDTTVLGMASASPAGSAEAVDAEASPAA
jgi:hypothetical protein